MHVLESHRNIVSRVHCPQAQDDILQDAAIAAWQAGLSDARAIATIVKRRLVDHVRALRGKTGKLAAVRSAVSLDASTVDHPSYQHDDAQQTGPCAADLYAAAGEYADDVRAWTESAGRVRQSDRVRAGLARIRRAVGVQ